MDLEEDYTMSIKKIVNKEIEEQYVCGINRDKSDLNTCSVKECIYANLCNGDKLY